MGDSTKMAKARRELEELYSGVPDDSVNLTFGDLAEVRQQQPPAAGGGRSHPLALDQRNNLDPITEVSPRREEVTPLAKLPSLDFSRGLEASAQYNNNYQYSKPSAHDHDHHPLKTRDHHQTYINSPAPMNHHHNDHHHHRGRESTPPPPPRHHQPNQQHHHVMGSPYNNSTHHGMQNSMAYDEMSQMSTGGFTERGGGRRRPGIPHSNICTICSTYIYLFRHRCLVCGRVYCRQCVSIGMGEMSEGRKCIECLGRRFSPRYIERAGQVGCAMGYPSLVKQQELKWAEKGPRGSGENRRGRSEMMSRPISPSTMLPARGHNHNTKSPPSFVSNTNGSFVMGSPSPYSPYYSPRNHPMPF